MNPALLMMGKVAGRGRVWSDWLLGKDGEIKGPGPFGAMSLVLLVIFRDLHSRSGPGFQRFRKLFIALSGTSGRNDRDV